MSLLKRILLLLCVLLMLFSLEFAIYGLSRALGDFLFLGVSIILCATVVWFTRINSHRLSALAQGILIALFVLTLNAYWADFVRNQFFDLAEEFGASAMTGVITYLVVLPLSVIAGILSAVLLPKSLNQNVHL